jgi:hypothetical protein
MNRAHLLQLKGTQSQSTGKEMGYKANLAEKGTKMGYLAST